MSVKKSSSSFLMVVGVINIDGIMTQGDTSNYVAANMKDAISHVSGVDDVQLFGSQYAMRIWMDSNELNKFQLTPVDIIIAVRAQNAQIATGQLGSMPPVEGQQLNVFIIAQTRLTSTEEFDKILLKVDQDGSRMLLRSVVKTELGGESYDIIAEFNGQPASSLGIKLAVGANALDTAATVRAELVKMESFSPSDLKIVYPYDTTPFVKISIYKVVKTLVGAIILMSPAMYLFLQNFHATLIPTIAVPVVLLEILAALTASGFSIDALTVFGMVLVIDLLVDDVIVVVENVERVMAEEGLPPGEATRKSMRQVQGALVGVVMVLSAILVPMAFPGGSTGTIYHQLSITVVSTMALSTLVTLIPTPTLCATILKPIAKGDHGKGKKGPFGWLNRMLEKNAYHYTDSVDGILRNTERYLALCLIIMVGMAYLFVCLSNSFLPDEG